MYVTSSTLCRLQKMKIICDCDIHKQKLKHIINVYVLFELTIAYPSTELNT